MGRPRLGVIPVASESGAVRAPELHSVARRNTESLRNEPERTARACAPANRRFPDLPLGYADVTRDAAASGTFCCYCAAAITVWGANSNIGSRSDK